MLNIKQTMCTHNRYMYCTCENLSSFSIHSLKTAAFQVQVHQDSDYNNLPTSDFTCLKVFFYSFTDHVIQGALTGFFWSSLVLPYLIV